MMILSVETATSLQSVALVDDAGPLGVETAKQSRRLNGSSSEHAPGWSLMPAIDRLLTAHHVTPHDLDGLAVSTGPGSFTGLRVGIATMKGLAHGSGKPLIAVPTLHALAVNACGLGLPICTLLDAKRGEVFLALFHDQPSAEHLHDLRLILTPQRLSIDAAMKTLAPHLQKPTVITGDGIPLCRHLLTERFGVHAVLSPEVAMPPSAISVAAIGKAQLTHGMLGPNDVTPIYLRPPDAKPNQRTLAVPRASVTPEPDADSAVPPGIET